MRVFESNLRSFVSMQTPNKPPILLAGREFCVKRNTTQIIKNRNQIPSVTEHLVYNKTNSQVSINRNLPKGIIEVKVNGIKCLTINCAGNMFLHKNKKITKRQIPISYNTANDDYLTEIAVRWYNKYIME